LVLTLFLKIKVHGLQVSVLAIVHKGSLETHTALCIGNI